jgi:UDP-glucuronate 4-epimerase
MTLLVTGAAGFIGSHFVERMLAESDGPIVCLDNFNDYYDPALKRANSELFERDARVTMVEGTFCDPQSMHELFRRHAVSAVVHLGAYAGVRPSIKNPLVYEENNVRGTLVLLEMAREFAVERFVFVSSSTFYGRVAAAPFREDQPLGVPLSPYGATKLAAELLCSTYVDLHRLPVVCVRPFSVYGPRLRPDLALAVFTAAILAGRRIPLFGDGSIRRDFTHVSDICAGLQAALTRPNLAGETINLGHGEPFEIRELLAMLSQALGQPVLIDERPAAPGDMPITCADLSRAERLLGYCPRVALADGVAEYVSWFRSWQARALA